MNIHLFIRWAIMVGLCACLAGLLYLLRRLLQTLATLEELHAALHEQAHGENNQDERERYNSAGKANESRRLSIKFLRKPLLCFCNIKKPYHLVLKGCRLLSAVLGKSNIKRRPRTLIEVAVSSYRNIVDVLLKVMGGRRSQKTLDFLSAAWARLVSLRSFLASHKTASSRADSPPGTRSSEKDQRNGWRRSHS